MRKIRVILVVFLVVFIKKDYKDFCVYVFRVVYGIFNFYNLEKVSWK